MGRIVNPRSTRRGACRPSPGQDLKLTLDLGLQKYLQEIFPDTMQGADRRDGARAPARSSALYSNPTYDPNDFVGGIPTRLWPRCSTTRPSRCSTARIDALYPPGSTFKLATAAVGARERDPQGRHAHADPCTGGMTYAGRYARCWDRAGHGYLDLAGAIEKSCNVYFYQVGIQLGLQELVEEGTAHGLQPQDRHRPARREGRRSSRRASTGLEEALRLRAAALRGHEPLHRPGAQLADACCSMAHFYSAHRAANGTAPQPHLVAQRRARRATSGLIDLDLISRGPRRRSGRGWRG